MVRSGLEAGFTLADGDTDIAFVTGTAAILHAAY